MVDDLGSLREYGVDVIIHELVGGVCNASYEMPALGASAFHTRRRLAVSLETSSVCHHAVLQGHNYGLLHPNTLKLTGVPPTSMVSFISSLSFT